MGKIAVFPGSFDPLTNGHLDIIKRASRIFDEVIVAMFINQSKKPLFTIEERVKLIEDVTKTFGNVSVDYSTGLLVDFVKKKNASVIVRGLRPGDFEYELQNATMNRKLDDSIESFFLMTNPEYSFLSSSIVKEAAKHHANIENFVPKPIAKALVEKFS